MKSARCVLDILELLAANPNGMTLLQITAWPEEGLSILGGLA
jgi:hypothetical protein